MDTYIQMAMIMKLSMLKKNGNPNFTYNNLVDIMYKEVWKKDVPKDLYKAVNDIMQINGEQLIRFLSKQAIIESKKIRIEDFTDLLGG